MKIRNSFVTNSSSSSFIIAVNKEIIDGNSLDKVILEQLQKNKSQVLTFLEEYMSYLDIGDGCDSIENELIESCKNNESPDLSILARLIGDNFLNEIKYGITLDNHFVFRTEGSNEDEEIFRQFLYDSPEILSCDKIKITSF